MADISLKDNGRNDLFFLVVGEESGDLHGSRLIREMKVAYPGARFAGIGGDKMSAAGMEILFHSNRLALIGFSEVIKHLPYLMRVMRKTLAYIRKNRPRRVILIDYPGFNLRLARKLARFHVPVTYFILPQVWAWKEKRVEILRACTDQCLSIMPFEPEWFAKRGLHVDFTGHPFVENLDSAKREGTALLDRPRLLLLPGSRQQEIERHWPVFLAAAEILRNRIPGLAIGVGKAGGVNIHPLPGWVTIEAGDIKSRMRAYTCGIVASGTATLEAAVSNLPEVVCYRLSRFSWFIARLLVHVPYASIVNVIAGKMVVPELLQDDMTAENIANRAEALLGPTSARDAMLEEYRSVHARLGEPGVYKRAAELILKHEDLV